MDQAKLLSKPIFDLGLRSENIDFFKSDFFVNSISLVNFISLQATFKSFEKFYFGP